jgi:hypothetical protein
MVKKKNIKQRFLNLTSNVKDNMLWDFLFIFLKKEKKIQNITNFLFDVGSK